MRRQGSLSQTLWDPPDCIGSPPPWYEMLPTKHRDLCREKPSSTRQPRQSQKAALTLHSRHHIRDPQFSPNQQATLEIEKALLKPPVKFLLTGPAQHAKLIRPHFRHFSEQSQPPFKGWHSGHQHHSLSHQCWVSKSVGRCACQSILDLLFALNEQTINEFPFWECLKYSPGLSIMALDGGTAVEVDAGNRPEAF